MKMSYRKVSNRSEVDDGLFGFRSGTMGSADRSIVSAEQLSAIRGCGKISNTAVVDSADLDRMKRSTLILIRVSLGVPSYVHCWHRTVSPGLLPHSERRDHGQAARRNKMPLAFVVANVEFSIVLVLVIKVLV
jgi:hypothetical protein